MSSRGSKQLSYNYNHKYAAEQVTGQRAARGSTAGSAPQIWVQEQNNLRISPFTKENGKRDLRGFWSEAPKPPSTLRPQNIHVSSGLAKGASRQKNNKEKSNTFATRKENK